MNYFIVFFGRLDFLSEMKERTLLATVADAFLVVDALKKTRVECLLFVTLSLFEFERKWLSVAPGRLLHE